MHLRPEPHVVVLVILLLLQESSLEGVGFPSSARLVVISSPLWFVLPTLLLGSSDPSLRAAMISQTAPTKAASTMSLQFVSATFAPGRYLVSKSAGFSFPRILLIRILPFLTKS